MFADQWNGIKDPDMNPYTYGHLIIEINPEIFNGEKKASSTNGAGINGCQYVEKCK